MTRNYFYIWITEISIFFIFRGFVALFHVRTAKLLWINLVTTIGFGLPRRFCTQASAIFELQLFWD